MSKYKEAKETLEKYDYSTKLELSEGIRNNITSGITVEQFFMMKETCIKLLDKATPMKLIQLEERKYSCPSCAMAFKLKTSVKDMFVNNQYCDVCGQALDWSKDE